MKNTYNLDKYTASYIKYHFVFCPRYRRKIFNIAGVRQRFTDLVYQVSETNGFGVIFIECQADHVHMHTSAHPDLSPSEIMRLVKYATSLTLREEFPQLSAMSNLWTRNYFVSTESEISDDTVKWYVETQKTRP